MGETRPGDIDLTATLNRKWWDEALAICAANVDRLDAHESRFFHNMQEGYRMAGDSMRPTVRQFNWLRQIAQEVTSR